MRFALIEGMILDFGCQTVGVIGTAIEDIVVALSILVCDVVNAEMAGGGNRVVTCWEDTDDQCCNNY